MNSLNAVSNTASGSVPLTHGTDPQFLVGKILRERIFDSLYWKEECYSLDLYALIRKAAEINHIGCTYSGSSRPVPFICLLLKLLQLQPKREILLELAKCNYFKYLRCLALLYFRMTASSLDCYTALEPFLADYSRLRVRRESGEYSIVHMDEFVDQMLTENRFYSLPLPRLTERSVLEGEAQLQPLRSEEFLEAIQLPDPVPTKSGKLSFKQSTTTAHPNDPSAAVKQRRQREKEEVNASLSLEATNELRAGLGLRPLRSH